MSVENDCAITAQERVLRIRKQELRQAKWALQDLQQRHAEELMLAQARVDTCFSIVVAHEKRLKDMQDG